ncbi:MAG: hypothetical protein RLZ04_2436, partial [Actinomycetota bacterium]
MSGSSSNGLVLAALDTSSLGGSVVIPPSVTSLTPVVEAGVIGASEVHAAAWLERSVG